MSHVFRFAAVAGLLMASADAYADDPTGVLLQQRHQTPTQQGHVPRYSDLGPCQHGTRSEPFPNGQGFRCVRR
jgi:hypothetical protein